MLIAKAAYADSTEWFVNGSKVDSLTNKDTIWFSSISILDTGLYMYVATNDNNKDTSYVARVDVDRAVHILVPLEDLTPFCEGDSLGLTFVAEYATTYSWYKNDTINTPLARWYYDIQ